jgi:hypothetical protein
MPPPPTKNRKQMKKKTKKETLSPTAKERKPINKDALVVGGRIGQIVRLPLLLTKNKFIHPTIQIWFCW